MLNLLFFITSYGKQNLLNYLNGLEKVKTPVQHTPECKKTFLSRNSIGDCSCLNPITRKFIIGSIDETKSRESKKDIKDQIASIKRDVLHIQDCR